MEHIVQFAIGIDDEGITKRVAETAEKTILKELKQEVANKIFESAYYRDKADPERDPLSYFSKSIVENMLEENKEYILDKASKLLAEKLVRSKAGKELLKKFEEDTNDDNT